MLGSVSEDNICALSTNPACATSQAHSYRNLLSPASTGCSTQYHGTRRRHPIRRWYCSRSPTEDLVTDNRFVSGFILSVEGPNNRRIGWASVYWFSLRSFNLHWHLARNFSVMSPRLLEPLRQTPPSDSDSLNYGTLMRGKATPIPQHPHESC